MKQVLTLLFFLILLGSCSNNHTEMLRLTVIDSLMEKEPQAAYDSLRKDSCMFFEIRQRAVRMKFRLLMAKAQNKLYLQMPSDSLFQEVVDYYEDKGDANEKMEAYYLLGCVFRSQKEGPKAVQSFEVSVGYADTLNRKCNFKLLSCIYGQMSTLFAKQNLLEDAIKAEQKMCKYALMDGDRRNFLIGKEQLAALYYSMGDTAKAKSQIEYCISAYRKNNMQENAAGALPLLMNICIKRQQLAQTYQYMKIFEKYSGLFDDKGNICHGREYYYHVKGQYFLGVNQLDSAKYYFEKLDGFGYHYEADKGLLAISRKQNDMAGMFKYSRLCEKYMDAILEDNQANAVLQVSRMYNFQKMQKTLDEQALAEVRMKRNLLLFLLLFVVLGGTCVYLVMKYKKLLQYKYVELAEHKKLLNQNKVLLDRSQQETEAWNDKYLKAYSELEQSKKELSELQEEFQKLDDSKKSSMKLIDDEGIYKRFKNKASCTDMGKMVLTDTHWDSLLTVACLYFPLFLKQINGEKGKMLSQMELRVTLLTRLHFSNSEMANLMNTSPASISNAKLAANYKLFGKKNAKELFGNMKNVRFDDDEC